MNNLFVLGSETESDSTIRAGLPPDAAERERALDVARSWIVEAPAGSGKTGLLIQRYLKLLAEESVEQPAQVLAITFTKKAAAEIRERVLEQLQSAHDGLPVNDTPFDRETRALAAAVLEKDQRLGWGLLDSPQRMSLKTIDSLCALIASSMPVLSGGGGAVSPVEDATPLYQAAARRTVMLLGGEDPALSDALRTVLLHRDGNLAECERLIAEMLALRDQWGKLIPLNEAELDDDYLDGTVLPKLERTLEQIICAGLQDLADSMAEDFLDDLATLASSLAEIEPYLREESPIAACAGRTMPAATADDLDHWHGLIHLVITPSSWTWRKSLAKNHLGFVTSKADKEQLRQLIERVAHREDLLGAMERVRKLPPARYPEEQWRVAKALFRLLRQALVELRIVFADKGECDFAELALLAQGALRQEGGVVDLQEALGLELRHLLVDEMQDTSTSQYELIQLLTQGWDGQSQTVFLVGDPKQSIYLFRQARVERFVRTMQEQRLGDLRVGCLRLTANFRSQRDLVSSFNRDFSLLFPSDASTTTPDEVPYVAAEPVRDQGHSRIGTQWHTRVIEGRRYSREAKREKRLWLHDEAQEVRAIVKEWRARPLPEGRREPWKIAVLVQTRRHLLDIVAALKEDDGDGPIPFSAVKIDPLGERQEVMDLFALTRALLHPADRVARLAVLRAPWCGLSLTDLHAVAGGDDPELAQQCITELMAERRHLLSEDGATRLQRFAAVIAAAESQRGRLKMAEWVERTWRSLGGDVTLTATELANARRYLQLLDQVEADGSNVDTALLKRRMEKLYAETTATPGAVDLMTIHGAKGLEWDVVLLPGLGRSAGTSTSGLLVWNEIEGDDKLSAHGMLAPIAGRGEPAKELNQWMKRLRDAREAAERKRLFYVACTRAREELHLFAAAERSAAGEILRARNSLLKAAWPAAEMHFADGSLSRDNAKVLSMSSPAAEVEDESFAIAASGNAVTGATEPSAMLRRLPLSFDPSTRFRDARTISTGGKERTPARAHFERPEGSFAARSFGNAVHAFLELVSKQLEAGFAADTLLAEVAGWQPRIEAVLRSNGLSPSTVRLEAQRVLAALQNSLRDDVGRWLLGAQTNAASEHAVTTWDERRSSFRLDRVFMAGTEPLAAGNHCLWIVDYKTTAHGRGSGVEAFLEAERLKYGAQMKSYAQAMAAASPAKELRVALYYPLLPKLVWWKPESV